MDEIEVFVCDVSDCPAPGTVRVLICEQDFHFCQHHANELADRLPESAAAADGTVAARVGAPV
jgi:hypothetical protein